MLRIDAEEVDKNTKLTEKVASSSISFWMKGDAMLTKLPGIRRPDDASAF